MPPCTTRPGTPLLIAIVLALGCAVLDAGAAPDADWFIVPGQRVGPIRATTSEADLVRIYGPSHVKREKFRVVVDADEEDTTAVWPQDPARTAHVVWKVGKRGKAPQMVIIEGTRSQWTIPPGITLGTPASTLDTFNGKAFHINGFAWDYGGSCDFRKGTLEGKLKRVILVLGGGNWEALTEAERSAISGEVDVPSSLPAVRKLKPTVTRIIVSF